MYVNPTAAGNVPFNTTSEPGIANGKVARQELMIVKQQITLMVFVIQ